MKEGHVQIGATAALLLAAAALISRKRKRAGSQFKEEGEDELLSLVGWTSRICAAARALETAQPQPLYQDPLAESLAGQKAMDFVTSRSQQGEFMDRSENFFGSFPPGQPRTVGIFSMRVKYLDDAILHLLNGKRVDGGGGGSGAASRPSQVVLLGAGMDTRAWRLPLPPGTKWFEVDMPEVLSVKRKLLRRMGAEVPTEAANGAASSSSSASQPAPQHALRAASYATAAGDLADGTWVEGLKAAGWDAAAPTVFLAEGLVRYLKPEVVEALFRTASQEAGAGSTMLATMQSHSSVMEMKASTRTKLSEECYWGYPDDPSKRRRYFESVGWRQTGFDTSASAARRTCGPGVEFSWPTGEQETPNTPGYLFFVAENMRL